MSAESPRRSRAGGPLVVPAQPPIECSLIDAVSGFISDVTTASPGTEPKDVIQWARFESADIDESRAESEEGDGDLAPLLLVVGYGSGVQVWVVQAGGEAQEALSWRQGSVRVLRLLPAPSSPSASLAAADHFATKRPLVALCDAAGPGAPYCSLSFISLTTGEQVKSIKFKNPILDVVANRRSVVVSFAERLAVFDACTFEDRLTVTTCYPAPCPFGGLSPSNPIALGDRWLAYAERRLSPTKRSNGGCEGEGVASYTATVLHAAKSLGKGLRGFGESVASSLGGRSPGGVSQSPSPPNSEQLQPGIITIIDIEGLNSEDDEPESMEESTQSTINESVVAHFVAHSEPIIALKFDASGMILVTADKRGHDFHVFRIHPHPSGPTLASVHHLYILHRGDTTAKVQDISISLDCRWTAVSTLRGTTHVFPITPYGGAVGVRTHATPHVVNRHSRFHRSAGLAADGRSNSPVGENLANSAWYPNPRLPPYPAPCIQGPLAQLRPQPPAGTLPTHTITRNSSGRQRLSSLSEESQLPLAMCSRWGAVRAPQGTRPGARTGPAPSQALYVMSAHGYLVQYYVHPKHVSGVPKEKVCDDTCIEVDVEAKAQWPLQRPATSSDIVAPLLPNNVLIKPSKPIKNSITEYKAILDADDRWLSQVEIVTHAGPHRRLWMGPQFVFKTYNATSGTSLNLLDSDAVEVGTGPAVARSNPVNMPGARPIVPVLIESGSASSLEHSPRLSDAFRKQSSLADGEGGVAGTGVATEGRLKEDLAEAMRDTEQGCEWTVGDWSKGSGVRRIVNPLGAVSGASSASPSPPLGDGLPPEECIMSNEDEALFRPVVSAPRSLPSPRAPPSRPLSDRVLIPAKLTQPAFTHQPNTTSDQSATDIKSKSQVIVDCCVNFKADVDEMLKAIVKDSSNKQPKKKPKDKKIEKIRIPPPPEQKCVPQQITKTETTIPSQEETTLQLSQTYVDDISKAVDNIEIFNDEFIENNSSRFSSYDWAKSSKNPIVSCNATLNLILDEVCVDDVAKKSAETELFPMAFSDTPDVSESFVLPIKNLSKKVVKPKTILENIKTNEESAWEMLSDDQRIPADDLPVKLDINLAAESFSMPEMKENTDMNKFKKRKTKLTKPKTLVEPAEIILNKNVPKEEIILDFVVPEESLRPSWSSIASSKTRKSVEKDVVETTSFSKMEVVEQAPQKVVEADKSLAIKLSSVCNNKNIVMALCDTPQSELCFLEQHHSLFPEPPPLEPLDLVLDDQKIQEMHDSLLDYSHGPPDFTKSTSSSKSTISSRSSLSTKSTLSDKSTSFKNDEEAARNIEDFISVSDYSLRKLKHYGEEQEDIGLDKMKFTDDKVSPSMEKSSDEENTSPSSSQTESDDCGTARPDEASVVADEPCQPPATNKSNKKKPKRKRR